MTTDVDYDALVVALHGTPGRPSYDFLHGGGRVHGHLDRAVARTRKALSLLEKTHPARPHVLAVGTYLIASSKQPKAPTSGHK